MSIIKRFIGALRDGWGNRITSTADGSKRRLDVDAKITGAAEINVEIQDIKGVDDIASITGNGGEELTDAQKETLFDEDLSTYYTLNAGETLKIKLKRPHDVHHIKFIGTDGNILSDITNLTVFYDDGNETTYPNIGRVEVKKQVREIWFQLVPNGSLTIDIAEVVIRQFSDARVHAPKVQPLNITEQDYAVVDDIDLEASVAASVGVDITTIMELLNQDDVPISLTANPTTITLIPKTKLMQVESVFVLDAGGNVVVESTSTIEALSVDGTTYTSTGSLSLTEVKDALLYVSIIVPPTVSMTRVVIKKYSERHVFAPSQQPVKGEEDQEITLQDVKAVQVGTFGPNGYFGPISTFSVSYVLNDREMKYLFCKDSSVGAIALNDNEVLMIFLKTPKWVEEIEALDGNGFDHYDANGWAFGWYESDGNAIETEGGLTTAARQVVKAKVSAIGVRNLTGATKSIYEVVIRTFKSDVSQLADESGNIARPILPSTNRFYGDDTTLNSAVGGYGASNNIGFKTTAMVIVNDGGGWLEFSFDGAALHGHLKTKERITLFPKEEQFIYFNKQNAGTKFRMWGW